MYRVGDVGNLTVCALERLTCLRFEKVEEKKAASLQPPPPPPDPLRTERDEQNKAQLILGPFFKGGESTDLQLACEACKQLSRLIRTALIAFFFPFFFFFVFPISDSVRLM